MLFFWKLFVLLWREKVCFQFLFGEMTIRTLKSDTCDMLPVTSFQNGKG